MIVLFENTAEHSPSPAQFLFLSLHCESLLLVCCHYYKHLPQTERWESRSLSDYLLVISFPSSVASKRNSEMLVLLYKNWRKLVFVLLWLHHLFISSFICTDFSILNSLFVIYILHLLNLSFHYFPIAILAFILIQQ